jgi:hypothetical protein
MNRYVLTFTALALLSWTTYELTTSNISSLVFDLLFDSKIRADYVALAVSLIVIVGALLLRIESKLLFFLSSSIGIFATASVIFRWLLNPFFQGVGNMNNNLNIWFLNPDLSAIFPRFLSIVLFVAFLKASIKNVPQGNEFLIERLGRYHRKLRPGMNFLIPLLDKVVFQASMKEKLLLLDPVIAITKDVNKITVEAMIYYKILDLERMYYSIENHEDALITFVSALIRAEIGKLNLEQVFAHEEDLNKEVILQGDWQTEPWGTVITGIRILSITVSEEYINEKRKIKERENLVLEGRFISEFAHSIRSSLPKISDREILNYLVLRDCFLPSKESSDAGNIMERATNSLSINEFLDLLKAGSNESLEEDGQEPRSKAIGQ